MTFFTSKRSLVLTSKVPATIARASLVNALHDNKFMIHLSSIVTDSEALSPNDPDIPATIDPLPEGTWYRVHEKVPLIGLISFFAHFENVDDGCVSIVHAPAGLIMRNVWEVVEGEAGVQGVVLREEATVEANVLLMPFILWNYENVHREMQKLLLQKVSEREVS